MAELNVSFFKTYSIPTESAFHRRKEFHSSIKITTESIEDWFRRIEQSVRGCDFGVLSEFMLIDKFISGLNDEIFQKFAHHSKITTKESLTAALAYDILISSSLEIKTEPLHTTDEYLRAEAIPKEVINELHLDDCNDAGDQGNVNDHDRYRDLLEGATDDEPVNIDNISKKRKSKKNQSFKAKKSRKKRTECNDMDHSHSTEEPDDSDIVEIKGFQIDEQMRIVCLDCGRSFKIKHYYFRHRRIHTGKNLHGCIICGKIFTTRNRLKTHAGTVHVNDGKSFECYLCSVQFKYVSALKTHLRVKHVASATETIALQCTYCSKKFYNAKTYEIHLKVHQGLTESHKCPDCNRVFDRRNQMLAHLATHSDARPFVCEICGTGFKTGRHLTIHKRRHLGEEGLYKCMECGKRLTSANAYKMHMRLHTGERPFNCDLCAKTFVQRGHLMKHLRVHRNEKPHGCTICDKRFATPYHLRLHMSVHTGAKPYQCKKCDRAYTQPGTLKLHQEKYHNAPMEVALMPKQ